MESYLSTLPKILTSRSKRVGRGAGSGRGAKSGRGTTRHQTARGDMPIHFEGGQGRLVKKFPLLRGKLRNKSIVKRTWIITLNHLESMKDGSIITAESVRKHNQFGHPGTNDIPMKVVATGKLTKALTLQLPVTKAARSAIEQAGGTVK